MKVVINTSIGGFYLTKKAILRLRELGLKEAFDEVLAGEAWPDGTIEEQDHDRYYVLGDKIRSNKLLIQAVEELGSEAGGRNLKIVDIPDEIEYEIHENDMGSEWIAEKHRKWFGI